MLGLDFLGSFRELIDHPLRDARDLPLLAPFAVNRIAEAFQLRGQLRVKNRRVKFAVSLDIGEFSRLDAILDGIMRRVKNHHMPVPVRVGG